MKISSSLYMWIFDAAEKTPIFGIAGGVFLAASGNFSRLPPRTVYTITSLSRRRDAVNALEKAIGA
jgi:hypothetical protein